MSAYDVNPCKGVTINSILDAKLPAIPSTKNKPTPLLSIRTVAYIHALVIDTVSLHHSDTPNQRALRTEQLIIDEHGELDPALWRAEILDCLTGYFEGILKMEGASGLAQIMAPARKYSAKKIPTVPAIPIDPTPATEPPAPTQGVAAPPPPPPAAAAAPAPAAAAPAPAAAAAAQASPPAPPAPATPAEGSPAKTPPAKARLPRGRGGGGVTKD